MFKGYNSLPTGFGTIPVVFYVICKLNLHILKKSWSSWWLWNTISCKNFSFVKLLVKEMSASNIFLDIVGMNVHEERLFVFNSNIYPKTSTQVLFPSRVIFRNSNFINLYYQLLVCNNLWHFFFTIARFLTSTVIPIVVSQVVLIVEMLSERPLVLAIWEPPPVAGWRAKGMPGMRPSARCQVFLPPPPSTQ